MVTIHNLAFQGNYPREILPSLNLPSSAWSLEGLEYYGAVGFLKGGLHAADAVTTVSPTYAEEIVTPEGGMGLDGLLRGRSDRLVGIVNGIDTAVWDPAADPLIATRYGAKTLKTRAAQQARRRGRVRPDARRRPDLRRGQPPHLAEGHGRSRRRSARRSSRSARGSPSSAPASR